MQDLLLQLIREGEHLKQDFKFAVTDCEKIARSLSAFANTEGGRLLLGVKDNGNIVGVRSDEEFYMIESAAQRYCEPPVDFTSYEWQVNGKVVLQINIPPSESKHYVKQRDGKKVAYVRVDDMNIAAGRILQKVWKREKQARGTLLTLNTAEMFIIDYLKNNDEISFGRFSRLAGLKPWQAERILVSFVSMGILELVTYETRVAYRLKQLPEL
jgi:predicted HTH transcriptional regulator